MSTNGKHRRVAHAVLKPIEITPQLVRTIIQDRCRLSGLPLNESLGQCGITELQRMWIRFDLQKKTGRGVPVRGTDTVYTLATRLAEAKLIDA